MKRHRARTCPAYSGLWAGDVRRKVFSGMNAYADLQPADVKTARVKMFTITAPGVDAGLVWDESVCWHLGEHRHSGKRGCKTFKPAADRFNELAPGWWTDLHNAAAQAVLRLVGHRPFLILRVWEEQDRGVLHVHVVIGYSRPWEIAAADLYGQELKRLSEAHGFGFVDDKSDVKEPSAAAAYLSSYFCEGKGQKKTLRESVTSEAMPPSIVYLRSELSQHSGVTMRSLRLLRYAYILWEGFDAGLLALARLDVAAIWIGLRERFTLTEIVASGLAGNGCEILEAEPLG